MLNSPEIAITIVKKRVAEGGHNIPAEVICRRYTKGIRNLFELFIVVCDYWIIIDNSDNPYKVVAEGKLDQEISIQNRSIWDNGIS